MCMVYLPANETLAFNLIEQYLLEIVVQLSMIFVIPNLIANKVQIQHKRYQV